MEMIWDFLETIALLVQFLLLEIPNLLVFQFPFILHLCFS